MMSDFRRTLSARLRPGAVRLVLFPVVWFLTIGPVAAATPASEIWTINTRSAPACGWENVRDAKLEYRRLTDGCRWESSDEKAFLEGAASGGPTTFFIHGYDVDASTATQQGLRLSRVLQSAADRRPWRLVIWSWPSTRHRGQIRRDAQQKAMRSDVEAYFLARTLDRMDAKTPVGLIGHSFGSRVITGGMEILSGGQVAGRRLPEKTRPDRPLRAVLVAAALDNGWLRPGGRNGHALEQLDDTLITCNPSDRVLRWYSLMWRRGGPEALGRTGPAGLPSSSAVREKVEVLGLGRGVGRAHGWNDYLNASSLRRRLPWYAFLEDGEK